MELSFNLISRNFYKFTESFPMSKLEVRKVTAVALACLSFFSLQMGAPLAFSIGISVACSAITFISEKLRDSKYDWFSTDKIKKEMLFRNVSRNLIQSIVIVSILNKLSFLHGQRVIQSILACDLRIIFLVTVIAPIAEEILFRGFLQERIEDLMNFTNCFICRIEAKKQIRITQLAQSLIFGLVHLPGGQVRGNAFTQAHIFASISMLGFIFGLLKDRDCSILPPIAVHWSQNTGVVLGLLISKIF